MSLESTPSLPLESKEGSHPQPLESLLDKDKQDLLVASRVLAQCKPIRGLVKEECIEVKYPCKEYPEWTLGSILYSIVKEACVSLLLYMVLLVLQHNQMHGLMSRFETACIYGGACFWVHVMIPGAYGNIHTEGLHVVWKYMELYVPTRKHLPPMSLSAFWKECEFIFDKIEVEGVAFHTTHMLVDVCMIMIHFCVRKVVCEGLLSVWVWMSSTYVWENPSYIGILDYNTRTNLSMSMVYFTLFTWIQATWYNECKYKPITLFGRVLGCLVLGLLHATTLAMTGTTFTSDSIIPAFIHHSMFPITRVPVCDPTSYLLLQTLHTLALPLTTTVMCCFTWKMCVERKQAFLYEEARHQLIQHVPNYVSTFKTEYEERENPVVQLLLVRHVAAVIDLNLIELCAKEKCLSLDTSSGSVLNHILASRLIRAYDLYDPHVWTSTEMMAKNLQSNLRPLWVLSVLAFLTIQTCILAFEASTSAFFKPWNITALLQERYFSGENFCKVL